MRCHLAGLGKSFDPTILWSYIPPVPTVKMVTFFPFLNIFCTGAWPTLPQIIACFESLPCWSNYFSGAKSKYNMSLEAKENRRHTKLFNKLSSILRFQSLFSENVFFISFNTTIVQN
jgi:hypothetical protein